MSDPNTERGPREVAVRARVAHSFSQRARGLLWSSRLPPAMALVLPRTRCVHGLGMNRALDLVFVGRDRRVLAIEHLPPWRWRSHRRAYYVFEFEAGEVARLGIAPGDRLLADLPEAARAGASAGARNRPRRLLALFAFIGVVLKLGLLADAARAQQGDLPEAWVQRFADRAEQLYQSGADHDAIDAYGALLDADPGAAATVILRVGNIHQRNGREWEAIDSYRRAIYLNPTLQGSSSGTLNGGPSGPPSSPLVGRSKPGADGSDDRKSAEARRKSLTNLLGLLESATTKVSALLDGVPVREPAMAAGLAPSPSSASAPLSASFAGNPPAAAAAAGPAVPAVVRAPAARAVVARGIAARAHEQMARPRQTPETAARTKPQAGSTGRPRIEYLGPQ